MNVLLIPCNAKKLVFLNLLALCGVWPAYAMQKDYVIGHQLIEAAEKGDHEKISRLISLRSLADIGSYYCSKALVSAAMNNHVQCLQTLIAAGAQVNKADSLGLRPLVGAASCGNLACVEILIKAGAYVNRANVDGNTALMLAAKNGHRQICELLVDAMLHKPRKDQKLGLYCFLGLCKYRLGIDRVIRHALKSSLVDMIYADNFEHFYRSIAFEKIMTIDKIVTIHNKWPLIAKFDLKQKLDPMNL